MEKPALVYAWATEIDWKQKSSYYLEGLVSGPAQVLIPQLAGLAI